MEKTYRGLFEKLDAAEADIRRQIRQMSSVVHDGGTPVAQ